MAAWLVALLALLVSVQPVQAKLIMASGFGATDDDTDANERDAMNFQQYLSGGAIDADIRIQTSAVHDDTNGGEGYWGTGTNSSQWAVYVDGDTGEVAYYQPCDDTVDGGGDDVDWPCEGTFFDTLSEDKLSVGLSINLDTGLSGGSCTADGIRIVEFRETNSSAGCALHIKMDGTLGVWYDNVLLTSISYTLSKYACTDNPYQRCTVDGDCGAGTCNSIRFFPGITLTEDIDSTRVSCELRINGRQVYASAPTVFGGVGAGVRNVRFGKVDSSACAFDMYVDDFVLDDDNAGYGYVAELVPRCPDGDGSNNWTKGGTCGTDCGTGYHANCIDALGVSPYTYDTTVWLQRAIDLKTEHFDQTLPNELAELPSGALLNGVTVSMLGRAGATGGNRKIGYYLVANEIHLETQTTVLLNNDTENRLLAEYTYPENGEEANWTTEDISTLEFVMFIHEDNAALTNYVHAIMFSVPVRLPQAALPMLLHDHNKGDEDGLICVLWAGDSMLGATGAGTCVGNEAYVGMPCTYASNCDWDTPNKDLPAGGCDIAGVLDHDMCTTCTGRMSEVPGAAGYYCDKNTGEGGGGYGCGGTCSGATTQWCADDSDCSGVGTCTKSTCTVSDSECPDGKSCSSNSEVCCDPLNGDADCEALGTCRKEGECEWTCGDPVDDGICPPTGISFTDYMAELVKVDVLVKCAEGGESSYELLNERFDDLLDGIGDLCVATIGSGRCRCQDDSDCQTAASGDCDGVCVGGSEPWTQCAADSDCAGSGTCNVTDKVCWGSDDGRDECHFSGPTSACVEISSRKLCDFPDPDKVFLQSSINDTIIGYHNPTCSQLPYFTSAALPCNCGSNTSCVRDSDCVTSVHEDSLCVGKRVSATGYTCSDSSSGQCTVVRRVCRSDGACDDADCSQDDDTDWQHRGWCQCLDDSDCFAYGGSDYYCRQSCIGGSEPNTDCDDDSDCDGGGTCGVGICFLECSVDSDCGNAVPRSCDGAAGMCRGYCTCPSASVICIDDGDCVVSQTTGLKLGSPLVWQGYCDTTNLVCVGGTEPGTTCTEDTDCAGSGTCESTCRCTGQHQCIVDATTCVGGTEDGEPCNVDSECTGGGECGICRDQYRNLEQYLMDPAWGALGNYDAMQEAIDDLSDSTPPDLVLLTIQPDNPVLDPWDNCWSGYGAHRSYIRLVNQQLMSDRTRFPYVMDFAGAFHLLHPYEPGTCVTASSTCSSDSYYAGEACQTRQDCFYDPEFMYRDAVHLKMTGALAVARGRINPWIASLNACSVTLCTDSGRVCDADSDCLPGHCTGGSEPGTSCSVDSDCAGSGDCTVQTCEPNGPFQKPQAYCKEADGDWTTTMCSDSDPCSDLTHTCSIMPCTCACSAAGVCTGSANNGESCASATACCTGEFGAGPTCSSGVCTGSPVCQGTGVACNPE